MLQSKIKLLAVLGLILAVGFMVLPGGATAAAQSKVQIAMVLDVGGRGDLSFNDMGFKGLDEAAQQLGVKTVVLQSASAADYLPNIRNAARSGKNDLIIAIGFLLADAVNQVAQEFPKQKFAIIDSVVDQPNVRSIVFRENESSALVGALAAMVAAQDGFKKVGVVLGIPIPVLFHFEAGYRFGIDWGNKKYAQVTGTNPNVGLLWTYTGTFSDIAKGKAATEAQLKLGAGLVYNVAGPLGIGDLEAISEAIQQAGHQAGPPFMIGVDSDQDWMGGGNKVLASAMKRVDNATFDVIKSVVQGNFQPGTASQGLDNGGVAFSRYANLLNFINFGINANAIKEGDRSKIIKNWLEMRQQIPYWIWDAVSELEVKIMTGKVTVPTANTPDEIQAIRKQFPLGG